MKKLLFSLLVMFAVLEWTCSDFPFGLGVDDSPDWVAITARINSFRQIVLVDFNNPTKYNFITNDQYQNFAPNFSPDRKQLVYLARRLGTDHDSGLMLVNIASGQIIRILHDKEAGYNMFGNNVVWGPDNTTLYFSQTAFITTDIVTYNLVKQSSRFLTATYEYTEYPVGFKGQDTLIVFSDDTMSTQQPPGYYYMDLNGNYLGRLNNPHLEFIRRDRYSYLKAAWKPDWNEALGLIVYSQKDNTAFRGQKVAVTNLDGSYFKTYTSGEYMDTDPVWGPDGKTVLFWRSDFPTGNSRVLLLDLESGRISLFVKPEKIGGATELSEPDY